MYSSIKPIKNKYKILKNKNVLMHFSDPPQKKPIKDAESPSHRKDRHYPWSSCWLLLNSYETWAREQLGWDQVADWVPAHHPRVILPSQNRKREQSTSAIAFFSRVRVHGLVSLSSVDRARFGERAGDTMTGAETSCKCVKKHRVTGYKWSMQAT